jgi:hypothetical protein
MHRRRRLRSRVALLALCAACSFDPSGLTGGGSGIGGDRSDGGSPSDAMSLLDAPPPIDARPLCGADCPGTCEGDVCHIECGPDSGGEGVAPGGQDPPPCSAVVCPPDTECYVHCIGQDACQQPIDCSQSSACRIDCTDDRSCAAQLTCGPGLCEIHCDGSDSCKGGLNCQSSCFCDVSCQGDSSCDPQTVCPAGCDADPDCKTSGAGCNNSC